MSTTTKKLYIQSETDGTLSPDSAAYIDAVKQNAWWEGESLYTWQIAPIGMTVKMGIDDPSRIIPIGSIEFIQHILSSLNLPQLQAVNVPDEFNCLKYLGRKVNMLSNKTELLSQIPPERQELFVKPGRTPKLFAATTTKYLDEVPDHEPLFVSELLSGIVAEWRAFVLRGRILTIRPYFLESWICPDKALVEEMAEKVSLPACTIDVAVLTTGMTVLMEVHPFISCGLYGFEGPNILRLANVAWQHQIQRL